MKLLLLTLFTVFFSSLSFIRCDFIASDDISQFNTETPESLGDPQFLGFRKQSFQIHGIDRQVYSIVSDSLIQVNARFDFIDQGRCPVYTGISSSMKPLSCWSRPGSYFGLITIQTVNGDRILVDAGSAHHGFQSVIFNGHSLTKNDLGEIIYGKPGSDRTTIVLNDSHHLSITAGIFTIDIDNSDMFVNIGSVVVNDWSRLIHKIKSHGLLGQTWKLLTDKNRGVEVAEIEGIIDDYAEVANDIWGFNTIYSNFIPMYR